MQFRSGTQAASAASGNIVGNPFEGLSLMERRDIVMSALEEAGAQNVDERPGYEIFHSCLRKPSQHPNGDRNPSASINYDKMVSGCWVCGGSHFLWWFANVMGLESYTAALTRIGEVSDVAIDRPNTLNEILAFLEETFNKDSPVYNPPPTYDPKILEPWKFVHPYLTEWRHIPAQNVMDLNVGYGKIPIRMPDGSFLDSHRIVIPHFFDGKLLGWQSRRIADDGTPKYVNTVDMPKDTTLFNYSRGPEDAVIVESPMTVITHNHCAKFFATFGTMVTTHQLELLGRSRARRTILWFDNDDAGWNATETVGTYLMDRGLVWAVQSPYVGDPGDLPSSLVEEILADRIVPFALWVRPTHESLVRWETPTPTAIEGAEE